MPLRLDERQRAMLAEMGIQVWWPASPPMPTPQAAPDRQVVSPVAPADTQTGAIGLDVAAAAVSGVQAACSPPAEPMASITPPPVDEAATFLPSTSVTALQQAVAADAVQAAAVEGQTAAVSADASRPVDGTPTPQGVPAHQQAPASALMAPVSNQSAFEECEKAPIPHGNLLPSGVSLSGQHGVPDAVSMGPVADMGWTELREAVSQCQACGLCASRTQTVFGVGAERADWMVIGEAPGEQEDLRGEPFVGPAGQLLDAMLHAVGVNRQASEGEQAVFIANVLKCRPPANRNPLPDEMARCQPYLRRQVALVQPKIILAMGRFAVQALLGTTEPIGRLRQQVHSYAGVPVIVSYHPAYLLRNLPEKAKAWADLVLAMQVAQQAKTPSAP